MSATRAAELITASSVSVRRDPAAHGRPEDKRERVGSRMDSTSEGNKQKTPTAMETPAGSEQADDLGLSIDMLDVDRLRDWANNLLVYGPDISQWCDRVFVASKMQQMATGIEKAVRDIGVLR